MRRGFILMMVALVTATVAWAYQPTVYEIDQLKDAMVLLNRDLHPNPDLVMPGDLVKVPADNPDTPGIECDVYLVYAVSSADTIYGRRNCFWRIAERHLQNSQMKAQTVPSDPLWSMSDSVTSDQTKVVSTKLRESWSDWSGWPLLILLGILAIFFVAYFLAKDYTKSDGSAEEQQREREEDPANYAAVMPAPMSNDPTAAAGQVEHFYGQRPTHMDRGFFNGAANSPEYALHSMAFGDGMNRPGRIYAERGERRGTRLYRGTMPDGEIRYFVMSCGNMGTEVLNVPQGWTWNTEVAADTPATLPSQIETIHQEPVTVPAQPSQDEPKTVSVTINPDGEQQAKLTITATGNESVMPVSLERQPDGTVKILFPKR